MPHYVNDPENPGQKIDVIELLRRHPETPPPVNIEGLLKRDAWTRQEALLILAGLAPRNVVHGGIPIGTIGAGIVYLDGTTSAQLDAQGLQHPRAQEWLPEFMDLSGYATGQDMAECKPPGDWIAWAEAKGFTPYWLAAPESAPAGEAATIEGPGTPAKQWQETAREIAQARWEKHKEMGIQGKLDDYAEYAAEELRRLKIAGPRGEWLTGGTVKREALQGAKWWQTRKL